VRLSLPIPCLRYSESFGARAFNASNLVVHTTIRSPLDINCDIRCPLAVPVASPPRFTSSSQCDKNTERVIVGDDVTPSSPARPVSARGYTPDPATTTDNGGMFTLKEGRTEEGENKPRPPGNTPKRKTEGESGSQEQSHKGHTRGLMKSRGRHVGPVWGDADFERQGPQHDDPEFRRPAPDAKRSSRVPMNDSPDGVVRHDQDRSRSNSRSRFDHPKRFCFQHGFPGFQRSTTGIERRTVVEARPSDTDPILG